MVVPDTSKFVGVCKDFLHNEWASYKKVNIAKPLHVCIYSVGGKNDLPAACLESVGNGFKELERIFHQTVDLSVDLNTPVVSQDVVVCVDGSIILFPERIAKGKEEKPSPPDNQLSSCPPLPAKKTQSPPTPEAAFMTGTEQIANYMLDHLKRMSESCLLSGNIKVLYFTLSSAHLIKGRTLTYKQVLKTPPSKALTLALSRCDETTEMLTQHLLNYHSDLIRSSILHDAPSHDWRLDRSYEEAEKVSLSIQMWCFYMQGVHSDLWRYTSPKIAESIFCNIFVDTLGLLVTRYMQIEPSEMRVSQMRGDMVAILFAAASFLPSLTPSPRYLLRGQMLDAAAAASIHRRMDLLLRVAALKCASVQSLAKVFASGIIASRRFSDNSKDPTEIESCPDWLTFLSPSLFPARTKHLASLSDAAAVYLTLMNAALRPCPNQGIILRGLFMRNFLASKVILTVLQDFPTPLQKGEPCGGAICFGHLCTSPIIPHTVYAAILQITSESFRSRRILDSIMKAGIKDSGNWDSLDKKQVWNLQRPPWHHALVELVAPHVVPVVAQLLESVPRVAPAQPTDPRQPSVRLENHLSAWVLQLLNGVSEVADALPRALVQTSDTVNALLPPTINPVGGHVISQLSVSALYSLLNSRPSLDRVVPCGGGITDVQWDLLVAVGERLCSLHEAHYEEALGRMTAALLCPLSEEEEEEEVAQDEILDAYTNEEAIEEVCDQMADHVLASSQGQKSFGIVWEFLKRNMDWLAHALQAPPLLPALNPSEAGQTPVNSPPPPRISFAPTPAIHNPMVYHHHLLFAAFDHASLMCFEGAWESVLEGDLWMPRDTICNILSQRPELADDAILDASQAVAVQKLKSHLTPSSSKEKPPE